ncbi:MAG: HNH endonuclease [Burkholderiaceae bacterium]|nr:HNH endonuclease [Burkholderiaceae bacterium]
MSLCNAFDGRCAYCRAYVGMKGTVDHYLPQALGGTNARPNLKWCCQACNNLKGDMTPDEWDQVRPALRPAQETALEVKQRLLAHVARIGRQRTGPASTHDAA